MWVRWKLTRKNVYNYTVGRLWLGMETLHLLFQVELTDEPVNAWPPNLASSGPVEKREGNVFSVFIFYRFEKVECPPKASGVPGERRQKHHQNKISGHKF